MDCLIQHPQTLWTGVVSHGLPPYHQRNYLPNFYFPRKPSFSSQFYQGTGVFFPNDNDVDYPTDIKGEMMTMPYNCMADDNQDVKVCVVCGERASGFYFGALVCLPCKSFYIRCTKEGEPTFTCQCSGSCDIIKQGRIRCQYCRYQRCLMAGMCRKEKPETVQPAEGQVLCKVCGDIANGIHFGVNTCEGCKKFFRRGLVENQSYVCKGEKECGINPRNRNNCRYCRFQKCIAVGMSREAIKMGRPKKADGSDLLPGNMSANPTSPSPEDEDTASPHGVTNSPGQPAMSPGHVDPGLGEDNDQLNYHSVDSSIKTEDARPSCGYLNSKLGAAWRPTGDNPTSWPLCQRTPVMNNSVPSMTTQATSGLAANNTNNSMTTQATSGLAANNANNSMTTQAQPRLAASEFIEEEMDEILMLLQNDNQSQGQNWKPCNNKIRCYGYNQTEVEKRHCSLPATNQPWNLSGMSPQDMQPLNLNMNEPMNMSAAPGTVAQPPPQYPGYNKDCGQEPVGMTCASPQGHRQSPTGYGSDSGMSVNSPGYVGNMSPMHSPSCQYSAQSSPQYQGSGSPQHSPQYQGSASPQHSDASPQGSPYSSYMSQGFTHPTTQNINDLSIHIPSRNNGLEPSSMQMTPPHYSNTTANSPPHSSCPMTIPSQEGEGNFHGNRNWVGAPHYSPSTNPATIPTQERAYRQTQASTSFENLQRINQYLSSPACCLESLHLMENNDGMLTGNDIEREVVYKTLASVSPKEPYHYVLSDASTSDSNSSSCSLDGFSSVGRQNKRKRCDDGTSDMSTDGLGCQVGRYKRQLTENYWNNTASLGGSYTMTKEKQSLLEHLRTIYTQMVDACNTGRTHTQSGQWERIQLRIIHNTAAAVKFAAKIPGFSGLHPEDKGFMCKTAAFTASVLMAGHQLYSPAENNFRGFWSCPVDPRNPFYPMKQRLLQVGARIHGSQLDMYEAAALSALLFLSTDFLDLVYPEALEDVRRKVIAALQAYEFSRGADTKSRLAELFHLVPAIRHVGVWHTEMMKQTNVTVPLQNVHQMCTALNQ